MNLHTTYQNGVLIRLTEERWKHEKRRELGSPVVSTRGGKATRADLSAVLMSVMMWVINIS
ncbi:MAG: hypothetical protein EWV55_04435, partial [Microcystis viridis Mv_BB_P_19951000_S69]